MVRKNSKIKLYFLRYYKKSDINREKNCLNDDTILNSISEYEVFKSNHLDTIYIETIIGQCKIYTYEEYEMLEEHTNSTVFCRASYDPVKVYNIIYY